MKKISFGIILPGNPDRTQEEKTWISILSVICKRGWIVALVITIIMIIAAFVKDSGTLFENAIRPAWIAMSLFFCSLLWSDYCRCPYCGHFFNTHRISSEQCVNRKEQSISRKAYDYHSGIIYDISGDIAAYTARTSYREHGTQITETLAVNKRCSHCGCVYKAKRMRITKNY